MQTWRERRCVSARVRAEVFEHLHERVPVNGRSMATMMNSSESMSSASSAVMNVCARKLSAPKKNVKPRVMIAPPNRMSHTTPGTTPSASTSRTRRAWVS
jgi:hypothetical protein